MNEKTTNKLLRLMILAGMLAMGLIYYNYATKPSVQAVSLAKNKAPEIINLDGTVKAQKEADLGFENVAPARITFLSKKVGDFVKAGTVLAQIENADSAAQIAQANQSVAAAQADLEQYQNDLSKEKYKLKSLKSSDAASNDKNAQKAQIEASQNVVTAQQARVLAAQAGVKIAQAQLAKTIILAPFDGIIAKQDLQIGEIASPGKSTIKIVAANDTYEIEALASQQEIANIKIGDMANVTLDAYGKNENFAAKVSNIDLGATLQAGVSTYKVTLEFLQKDERIKSGMNANVTLKQ